MACEVWATMDANDWPFDAPYDFEFMPMFLANCTNAISHNGFDLSHTVDPANVKETAWQLYQLARADEAASLARQNLRTLRENPKGRLIGERPPV